MRPVQPPIGHGNSDRANPIRPNRMGAKMRQAGRAFARGTQSRRSDETRAGRSPADEIGTCVTAKTTKPACESCEARKANPQSGLYHAKCKQCQARQSEIALPLHMGHLKRTPGSADRRVYIEIVERKEGAEAAQKLKAAFTEWWGHK